MGIAALAVSAGGAVTAANPALIGSSGETSHVNQASALGGDDRRAPAPASSTSARPRSAATPVATPSRTPPTEELVEQAEQQAQERNAALAKFAKQAEAQAAKIALNQWVLPVDGATT